jgi:3-isopropylmalate/(R)-2-methylmalate dehydratase small subunit
MDPFVKVTGVVAPLDRVNIDTDQIIPAIFLKRIERSGFEDCLFFSWRFNEDGSAKSDFVLNQPEYRNASVLVAGHNFGCGSSREHAPWALRDYGIRCVIAPSFADIFYNNCFKNGILPVTVGKDDWRLLLNDADNSENPRLTVDLEALTITRPGGDVVTFEIDGFRRDCLLNGLDDIGLTLQKADKIDAFEAAQRERQPWLYAAAGQ